MAAAAVTLPDSVMSSPFLITSVDCSVLTSAQEENIPHGGPDGGTPFMVLFVQTAAATSDAVCNGSWEATDTTNNEIDCTFQVEGGGNIANATFRMLCFFENAAAQDESSLDEWS